MSRTAKWMSETTSVPVMVLIIALLSWMLLVASICGLVFRWTSTLPADQPYVEPIRKVPTWPTT